MSIGIKQPDPEELKRRALEVAWRLKLTHAFQEMFGGPSQRGHG
jgi:hypothetical protein